MKIYHYAYDTQEYLGISNAMENPRSPGDYLLPAQATFIKPPAAKKNTAYIFEEASQKWKAVMDYRGTSYYLSDRTKHEITELGVQPPKKSSKTEPPLTSKEIQQQKLAKLETEFYTKSNAPIKIGKNVFRIDAESLNKIKLAFDFFDDLPKTKSEKILWMLENKKSIELSKVDLKAILKKAAILYAKSLSTYFEKSKNQLV